MEIPTEYRRKEKRKETPGEYIRENERRGKERRGEKR